MKKKKFSKFIFYNKQNGIFFFHLYRLEIFEKYRCNNFKKKKNELLKNFQL